MKLTGGRVIINADKKYIKKIKTFLHFIRRSVWTCCVCCIFCRVSFLTFIR